MTHFDQRGQHVSGRQINSGGGFTEEQKADIRHYLQMLEYALQQGSRYKPEEQLAKLKEILQPYIQEK